MIGPTTTSWGVGPVSLDVAMARRHGWSEEDIQKTAYELGKLSRCAAAASHWDGPVKNCPCVTCDLSIETKDLPESIERQIRARWEKFNAGGEVNGAAE